MYLAFPCSQAVSSDYLYHPKSSNRGAYPKEEGGTDGRQSTSRHPVLPPSRLGEAVRGSCVADHCLGTKVRAHVGFKGLYGACLSSFLTPYEIRESFTLICVLGVRSKPNQYRMRTQILFWPIRSPPFTNETFNNSPGTSPNIL